jgi:hypothetical protein
MGCRRGKRAESPNRRKIGNMIRTKLPARRIPGFMARLIVGLATTLLLWNGAAVVVGAGAAEAPRIPAPQSWPGCPPDHPEGPCHWCPGDPPVQTGNLRVNPSSGTQMSATRTGTSGMGRAMSRKHFRGKRATASAASTAAGSQLLPDPGPGARDPLIRCA